MCDKCDHLTAVYHNINTFNLCFVRNLHNVTPSSMVNLFDRLSCSSCIMTSPFVSGVTNVTLFGDAYGDLNVTVDAANTSLSFPAGFPKTAATGAVMEAQLRCQYFYYFLINSLGAGMFCLVGFVGNALSCAVLSRDRNTSPVACE